MKKLTERYGRFHARFPLDDVYLALPRTLRNDAYLYLLALSGQRRAEEADMNCPRSVADALAHAMGLDPKKMLEALAAVKKDGRPRIVELVGDIVRLLKHDKWQDTPEQIAELKEARAEAGRRGAEVGWDRKRQQASQQLLQQKPSKAPAIAGQVLQQIPAETERETEREITNPPVPPSGGLLSAQAIEVIDWWCGKRGWQAVPPSKQREVYRDAGALASLGLEEEELLRLLHEIYEAAVEKPYSLQYFWVAAQERFHELMKVQTPLRSVNELVRLRNLNSPPDRASTPAPPQEATQ